MNAHPDVETLSTYLDHELDRPQHAQIEDHLDACEDCREHLSNLQKVVRNLQALERLAPPPHLGMHLHRQAALQASRPSLVERLEQGVSRFNFQSTIAPVFAVVMALILIIYTLSWGIHRQANGRIPVHLEPQEMTVDAAVLDSPRQVAGRTFGLVNGIWAEEGLDTNAVAEPILASDPRVQSWFARSPELKDLETLGERVRLTMGDAVVEIRFDDR